MGISINATYKLSILQSILGIIRSMSMFSFHKKITTGQWLLYSSAIFAAHIVLGLIIVIALNDWKFVNHALTPVLQYLGLFKITFAEQPLFSLHFLATKSIFVLSNFDPRSSLNLWTLEYDFYTLLVYFAVSLLLGRILAARINDSSTMPIMAIISFTISAFFLSFSISYMTVLEHCSGATWVGFVTLYGLGLDEFELYPIYQIICAAIGILGFIGTYIWLNRSKNVGFS